MTVEEMLETDVAYHNEPTGEVFALVPLENYDQALAKLREPCGLKWTTEQKKKVQDAIGSQHSVDFCPFCGKKIEEVK